MSVPDNIFLDTNIFDGQQYDFNSREFRGFKAHLSLGGKRLLLPDPIKREIDRHLEEKSSSAASAFKGIQKENPFVRRAPGWPLATRKPDALRAEILESAKADLRAFLDDHKTTILDYSGVDMVSIMDWYDNITPPFGQGEKRKEFPDALAIAILDHYCLQNRTTIAVISNDRDFEKACAQRPHLFQYPSLLAYVEASLFEKEERLKTIRTLLAQDQHLSAFLKEQLPGLGFIIEEDWDGEVSNVEPESVTFLEQDITAVEDEGFEISFRAEITFYAEVNYDDPDSGHYDREDDVWYARDHVTKQIEEKAILSGSAFFSVDEKWEAIEDLEEHHIDQDTITIQAQPLDYD